jgi:hypothetical protein
MLRIDARGKSTMNHKPLEARHDDHDSDNDYIPRLSMYFVAFVDVLGEYEKIATDARLRHFLHRLAANVYHSTDSCRP